VRLLLLALLSTALPAQAQMYKCVDERGVTHYTDKPTAACRGTAVDIRPSPPLSGQVAPAQRDSLPQQDADFKRRRAEREDSEGRERAVVEQRCARLRDEYAMLASGVRLFKFNSKGEREFEDDAVRDARQARVKEALRACP
jgi:hypothetical protein